MSIIDWAEKEVEIACKRENPEWDGKSFDYGCACYLSALKAYKAMVDDEHSLASWALTRNVLERLLYRKPLTPITEQDFEECGTIDSRDDYESRQCPRMTALFKKQYADGRVEYSDVDRVVCVEPNGMRSNFGMITRVVNEMYPIELPYLPKIKPYEAHIRFSLVDKANGDFDTVAFFFLLTPEGKQIDVNRFWTTEDDKWVEITKEKYQELQERINDCAP